MSKKLSFTILIILIIIAGIFLISKTDKTDKINKTDKTDKTEKTDKIDKTQEKPSQAHEEEIEKKLDVLEQTKPDEENFNDRSGGFKVSSAKDVYPKFILGFLDPKKPRLGEEQDISIKMRDPQGIQSVKMEIKDNEKNIIKELDLNLKKGDKQEGTWGNTWKVEGVSNKFILTFLVENSAGQKDNLTYFVQMIE